MRRLLPVLAGLVIVVGGVLVLMSVFSGKDASQLEGAGAPQGPGTYEPRPGEPPTSGPADGPNLTGEVDVEDGALVTALALGNVALVYGTRAPPPRLLALRERLAGPFDAELAAAGQMAFLVRRPGTEGIVALAWQRRLEVADASDPALADFVEYWIGRGAP